MFARALRAGLAVLTLLAAPACTRQVDIKQTFKVSELSGGWYDAGIVDGKNKLVPTVSFRIEKNTADEIRPLAVNVLFKQIKGDSDEEWDDVFLQRIDFAEGNRTAVLTVRPAAGATGDPPQSRADMLKNSFFVDIRAVIFAKQSSSNWVELARYDIPRQILPH
jgi:hypothetical protein